MTKFIISKLMYFITTKFAKNIAISIIEVLVRRTNNKWDDELLTTVKSKKF